jgi:SAM-dependent methyltransferase
VEGGKMDDEKCRQRWNAYYQSSTYSQIRYSDWLSPHLAAVSLSTPIIEFGCGFGYLSELLFRSGYDIVATDIAQSALDALEARVPGIKTRPVDIHLPLPFSDESFGVAVADLCLHYFDSRTTASALAEIARLLRRDGLLCARVNSDRDYRHGAGVGHEIEHGFFEQNGHFKRFFDEPMVQQFFRTWRITSFTNYDTFQYEEPKNVYEIVARPERRRALFT